MLSLPCATEAGRAGREGRSRCCDLHLPHALLPPVRCPQAPRRYAQTPSEGLSGSRFASFIFYCHLFIRGKTRVASYKMPLFELCLVQGLVLIFSLFFSPNFQNSYLWRLHIVCMVRVSGLSSLVPIKQRQTVSCVVVLSAAGYTAKHFSLYMLSFNLYLPLSYINMFDVDGFH